jgi:ribosomal protein S19
MSREILGALFRALLAGVLAFSHGSGAYGQVSEPMRLGGHDTCAYFGEDIPDNVMTFASDQEASDVIKAIIRASGLVPNFVLKASSVLNAAAVTQNGKRYILYNQYFVRNLNQQTGNRWAAVSVLAHEIGHHLNGHTLGKNGNRPRLELEADYYSGFILQRMGATLEDARRAMEVYGPSAPTPTHPGKQDRLAAITNGWVSSCSADPRCRDDQNAKMPQTTHQGATAPAAMALLPAQQQTPAPVNSTTEGLLRPGSVMQTCGCWGPNPRLTAPEPKCQNGQVVHSPCPGSCPSGKAPYAYVCQ